MISLISTLLVFNLMADAQSQLLVDNRPSIRALKIQALEGEGAINFIPAHIVTIPVVEVRDENERPVEGATVTFTLPQTGPGGTFRGGKFTLMTITDQRGQAGATGFTANAIAGQFIIKVTASRAEVTGAAVISQTNTIKMPEVRAEKHGSKWKWIVLGVAAGAGAGAGIYFGTKSSGSSPLSISAGPVVFGAPR
jgi:hypothetical protein